MAEWSTIVAIRDFNGKTPDIADSAYIDEHALVIGDVKIGESSSLWPMAVARGDVNSITIGKMTNIQDGSVLHVTHDNKFSPGGFKLQIGDHVTVGHRVTLHACTVGNYCLLGMSATVMDGAVLGDHVFVAAGALVPPGKELQDGYLYVGSPARKARPLTKDELSQLEYSASHYAKLAAKYAK